MTPKSIIVLRALLEGQTLDLFGRESRLVGNQLCLLGSKIVQDPEGGPIRGEDIWLSTEVSLRGFLNACEELTDDDAMIIAANTALTEIRRSGHGNALEARTSSETEHQEVPVQKTTR